METEVSFATYTVLAIVIRQVIDRVRKRAPGIDGDYVLLAAFALSVALAWFLDVRAVESLTGLALPVWADYIGTALALTFGSGFVQDLLKNLGTPIPTTVRMVTDDTQRVAISRLPPAEEIEDRAIRPAPLPPDAV